MVKEQKKRTLAFIVIIAIVLVMGYSLVYYFQHQNNTPLNLQNSSENSSQKVKNFCSPDSRNKLITSCPKETVPSCGYLYSQNCLNNRTACVIGYLNPCLACINPVIEYWTEGYC